MSKQDNGLFSYEHTAHQAAYGDCPKCQSPFLIKHKGKSSFIGCSAYPECDYTHSLSSLEVVVLKVMDDSHCPECQSPLAVKKGRYGMFIGCTNFPECHYISYNKSHDKKDHYQAVSCPQCSDGSLQKKQNKFGKYFYACDNYPKCKFVLNQEPVGVKCENCDASVMVKLPKDNQYLCINPQCKHKQQRE
ncbi:topoisomerase DNA-binding C4 zinc finger domain-containing protein [Glaciecola sp. 1036]|uniref:DNA topoisomerase family protein n=1 Tax=Alteromonadaceae TaxID=72275 RepID=UPI003D0160FA